SGLDRRAARRARPQAGRRHFRARRAVSRRRAVRRTPRRAVVERRRRSAGRAAMSRTRIKFCGIVDPRDARDAAALGVDAIGLVFYPKSPRAIDLARAAGIRRALPSYVAAVGLFVDAPPEEVRRIAGAVGLDAL